jgi:F-type H+-transporting ATPase subunit b
LEGIGSLGINLPSLIAQLIAFFVLFGLMYVVAYKPILRMLDERSKRIKESMDQAQQIKEQTTQAEVELNKQIEAGRKEGQEIIKRAMRSSEEVRQKVQQDARQEGEAIIAKARSEIQRERDEAVAEIRQEFADLAITAAEKVIDRSLDKEAHRHLIDKVISESKPKQG